MFNTRLKLASLLILAASAAVPALAVSSGPTSTVVYVGGNDLVLKAADGTILNYPAVPASTAFASAGKPITWAQLKPGTQLSAPVSTGTDPQVVASITVLKAKVYGTAPPDGITLTTPDGAKNFVVPAGTTFLVGGKALTLHDLASDVTIDATIVTPLAEGADPVPPPVAPPLTGALLVVKSDELPLAGTNLPLYGVVGFAMLLLGFALLRRKPVSEL
jgi:LPXTG-motif cell wall-anchored protein